MKTKMKQTITISLCFFISFTLSAQYKKASFFSKQGRTYELGTNFSYLGSGQAPAVSIVYSGSLETSALQSRRTRASGEPPDVAPEPGALPISRV